MQTIQVVRFALLFAVAATLGCDDRGIETYPVRGKVIFVDDAPVKFGRVEFYHATHDLTSHGTIQPDGSFQLGTYQVADGAPAGDHKVAITQLIMPGEAGVTPHEHGRHIDGRYATYETSGLQRTVKETENELTIIVVDAGN